jgi:S-adenosylmethionine synthetase
MKKYFTSESVTEGHPDKICDKIADKILDTALETDKNSKMAVEATIKDDLILITGGFPNNAEEKTTNFMKIEKI